MTNILLSGCTGRMGLAITSLLKNKNYNIKIICGISNNFNISSDYPIYKEYSEIPNDIANKIDVVLDFSHPTLLNDILKFCTKNSVAIVLCTTGYTKLDIINIKLISNIVPVFMCKNMSFGINLIKKLLLNINKRTYKEYDIEIVEKHHNKKVDAPSGTALLFADEINKILDKEYVYKCGRQKVNEKRDKKEIGIHSIRCGNIIGEHKVIMCCNDEEIEITHRVYSKDVFADCALKVAKFIKEKQNGIYTMKDFL